MRSKTWLGCLFVVSACGSEGTATAPPSASAPSSASAPASVASARSTSGVVVSAKPSPPSPSASSSAPAPSRPLYYEVAIVREDLEGRTLRELSLMRNTIYARAGNPFRKPWLDGYFKAQPWYQPKTTWDESKITPLDRQNSRTIAEFDAAIPKEDLERRRDEVLQRKTAGKATAEDGIELSLLSQRLGTWLGDESEKARSPLEDITMLDKLLTVEQLSTMSRRDLRMLRNTIYARRGMPFQSKVVAEFFRTAAWYTPDPTYDDGRLNEIDVKNVTIIKSVETSLGGPEHENPDYGKDGWFIAA
jgi:hypothetical protein